MLLDTMDDGVNKMSVTDIPKILIEQAIERKFTALKVTKRRKVYQKFDY